MIMRVVEYAHCHFFSLFLLLHPAVALKCSRTVCVHIWKLFCTICLWGKGDRELEHVQDTDNN